MKAGKDEDSCPQNFFHRGSYVWCYHQDLRRWASIGCNRRQNEVRHFAQNWAFLRFTYFKRRKHSFSSLIPSTQCCADVRSGKLSTSLQVWPQLITIMTMTTTIIMIIPEFVIFWEKKNKLLFKKLTICQLSWGDKTLHWKSFHEDYCNKIHTNKTKKEDRKIVSIVR